MAAWPYNTGRWQALRAVKLQASPVCEHCAKRGLHVRATAVDHIIAISKGGAPFPPLAGLRSLCARCHNQKTRAVDTATGKGVAVKGANAAGLPLDASHPFLRAEGYTPSKDGSLKGPDRHGHRVRTKFQGR